MRFLVRGYNSTMIQGYRVLVSVLVLTSCYSLPASSDPEAVPEVARTPKEERVAVAQEKLSRVFGLQKPEGPAPRVKPPEYMLDLYDSVADESGVTRAATPYDANTVRSMPDRAGVYQSRYWFNATAISSEEKLLEVELHLFKIRSDHSRNLRSPRFHVLEIKIWQILDPTKVPDPSSLKLLDVKQISAYKAHWYVFRIKTAVEDWMNNSSKNFGLLVTSHRRGAQETQDSGAVFAQRGQHHDSKQPILVLFTDDGATRIHNPVYPREYAVSDGIARRLQTHRGNARYHPRNVMSFLNEEDRAALRVPSPASPTQETAAPPQHRRVKRRAKGKGRGKFFRPRGSTCAKRELYVDFVEIGWSGWIISPRGYNAYQCQGHCNFPLGQAQHPTNHATVQSIVHALKIVKGVSTPCCVPDKLYSISLLYFDENENVILKQYDDMVVGSCGCH